MNTSKVAVVVSLTIGKILSIIGYVMGIIMLFTILTVFFYMDLVWDLYDIIALMVLLFIFALCVLFVLKGVQIKRRIKRFRRYISLISAQNMTSIENLAAATNQSVDFVKKDLQRMIRKRFFADASINAATNEIIICSKSNSIGSVPTTQSAAVPSAFEVFTCTSCGASGKKEIGKPGSCDYCGSHIKG